MVARTPSTEVPAHGHLERSFLSARTRQQIRAKTPPAPSRITVRVQPKASRNSCAVDEAGRIRVSLTAPPVDGAANDALVRYMSELLQLPRRAVTIVSGEKSRDKILAISGLALELIAARLKAAK
ncbi:MAG: DUF167 domain-containing protein [Candidatus Hydrogenedentes bacterium]|nr:DUF167 domain-containing protein [Candidatus Hydrogenedentota bacterium]